MKTEKAAFVTAVLCLILAAWCAFKIVGLDHRLAQLKATAPDVGEVMLGVQVHLAKLFFAADAKNWKLAEFEIHEIEENLETASALRPTENGVNLINVVDAFKQTQLAAMRQAVAHQNPDQFAKAYQESMATCNGCHQTTGRPFLVITRPTAPPVWNQQWAPPAPAPASTSPK